MKEAESEATKRPVRISTEVEVQDSGLLLAVTGPSGANLKPLETSVAKKPKPAEVDAATQKTLDRIEQFLQQRRAKA